MKEEPAGACPPGSGGTTESQRLRKTVGFWRTHGLGWVSEGSASLAMGRKRPSCDKQHQPSSSSSASFRRVNEVSDRIYLPLGLSELGCCSPEGGAAGSSHGLLPP